MLRLLVDAVKRLCYSPEHYARSIGVKVGRRCRLSRSTDYSTEPYLIEIGDHVLVSQWVAFIPHDGGVFVFRDEVPDLDVFGRIRIGSNSYIGYGAVILAGVTIGSNCVVGAGSVVTKAVPDGTVVAGVPSKFVSTIDEYRQKMIARSSHTAKKGRKQKKAMLLSRPQPGFIVRELLKVDPSVVRSDSVDDYEGLG